MSISPESAVAYGTKTVNYPVIGTMIALGVGGVVWAALAWSRLPLFISVFAPLLAWPVWSWRIARWRDWVVDHGLEPDDVHELAVRAGLLWPRGSALERTEMRRRSGQRGW
jgi:hypothetical protein